ncbi:acyl-CoA carboxylase subunit epsilon [Kitasatospora camelliae]|uniref:Acyl-CoA carboxylase subunit epsilon n=1 Tax=Kitasatospora camelliae TaxID=3156397 RepID=A0AAU8K274_9ACTN
MSGAGTALFQVERGSLAPEELAALTVVLLARLRAAHTPAHPELPRAGWTVSGINQAGSWSTPGLAIWHTAV